MIHVRDEDEWVWFAEQREDDRRSPHPFGCLLVLLVCALLWGLIVVGAVVMYPD